MIDMKRKRAEKSIDLTSFFEVGEEKSEVKHKKLEEEILEEEIEKIESYIREKGVVPKSSLYKWAIKNGISPRKLYLSLKKLIERGKVMKKFDSNLNEISYSVAGGFRS